MTNESRTDRLTYTFPAFTLPAYDTAFLDTAEGVDDLSYGDFYWGQDAVAWTSGDLAVLRDAKGAEIDTYVVE